MTQPLAAPQIADLLYLDHLGAGGYSDVFLYERRSPTMRVAVKVLKDARLSDAERAQFATEAETMAELADHPYIVQVFSTGTLEDGRPYLVMKYYPPPNLAVRAASERLSLPDALRTGVKIASAVETAHRAGILHRDIKPANILISPYGEPGLTDFGIAGHAIDTVNDDDLGVSIPWSPPEVLSGASNGSVQSDVYSLAATVWHLLAGRSPFEIPGGDNSQRALMGRILRSPPPATGRADVPASLDRLLQQGMAKSPSVRPRSALELARALQGVEQEQRLGRTEIVVEGPGAAGGTTGERPGGDQTRLRAPTRVQAQSATPPVAAPPQPSGTGSPATSRRPAAQTERRVAPPVAAAPARRRADAPRATADETLQRHATAPPDEVPDAEPTPRRGLRRKHAGVLAGVLVVGAIVLGVVLSGRGSPSKQQGNDTPSFSATGLTDAPGLGVPPPVVHARYERKRQVVHFTWRAPTSAGGYRYAWFPAGEQDAQQVVDHHYLDQPSTGEKVCIQVVAISSDGSHSSPSDTACGG